MKKVKYISSRRLLNVPNVKNCRNYVLPLRNVPVVAY